MAAYLPKSTFWRSRELSSEFLGPCLYHLLRLHWDSTRGTTATETILTMTIYIRTELGISAILSNSSELTRKQRTLLIAVDGRTDSASFDRNLSSFGDVLALLESLKAGGYIETAKSDVSLPKSSAERTETLPTAPSFQQNSSDLRYIEEQRAYRNNPYTYQPASGTSYVRGDERAHFASDQLKAAVSLMSDFVAQHLPQQALEIVLGLERLASVEALTQSLGRYEQLLQGTGEAGQHHLLEVRTVLNHP